MRCLQQKLTTWYSYLLLIGTDRISGFKIRFRLRLPLNKICRIFVFFNRKKIQKPKKYFRLILWTRYHESWKKVVFRKTLKNFDFKNFPLAKGKPAFRDRITGERPRVQNCVLWGRCGLRKTKKYFRLPSNSPATSLGQPPAIMATYGVFNYRKTKPYYEQ